MAAAVLGGARHGQVGVTGDTVNVTARLLDAAKSFETDFITTAPLLTAAGIDAGDPRSGFVFLDRQTMRGRQRVIAIYGVTRSSARQGSRLELPQARECIRGRRWLEAGADKAASGPFRTCLPKHHSGVAEITERLSKEMLLMST